MAEGGEVIEAQAAQIEMKDNMLKASELEQKAQAAEIARLMRLKDELCDIATERDQAIDRLRAALERTAKKLEEAQPPFVDYGSKSRYEEWDTDKQSCLEQAREALKGEK